MLHYEAVWASNAESSLVKQLLPLAAPFGFLVLLSSVSGITIKMYGRYL